MLPTLIAVGSLYPNQRMGITVSKPREKRGNLHHNKKPPTAKIYRLPFSEENC
jgi:hypothetical protein